MKITTGKIKRSYVRGKWLEEFVRVDTERNMAMLMEGVEEIIN